MVKRTLEVFVCDVCGQDGERYTVTFPDGQMIMDRCDKHNSKLEKMRDEKGSWTTRTGQRSSFKVSSISEIEKQRRPE